MNIDRKNWLRRLFFGFVVGTGLGFLVVGLFLLYVSGTGGGFIPMFLVFYLFAFILGFFVSLLFAQFGTGLYAPPFFLTFLLIYIIWPVTARGPFVVQEYRFDKVVASFDIYPGSVLLGDYNSILGERAGSEGVRAIKISFSVNDDDIKEFFTDQYIKNGWVVGEYSTRKDRFVLEARKSGWSSYLTMDCSEHIFGTGGLMGDCSDVHPTRYDKTWKVVNLVVTNYEPSWW